MDRSRDLAIDSEWIVYGGDLMLFEGGVFAPQNVEDERTAAILDAAVDRSDRQVRPSDLLASAIASGDVKILATLTQALEPGCRPLDLREVIEVYNPTRTAPTDFDGTRGYFAPETLKALNQFEADLRNGAEGIHEVALELLLSCILCHMDAEDHEFLTTLNIERAATLFREQVERAAMPLAPLFDSSSGRMRSDEFTEGGWVTAEHAAVRAAELGYDRILPAHYFLALLGETEGVAEHLVRLQAQPEIGPGKVADIVAEAFRLADRKLNPLALSRDDIGEATVRMLRAAQKVARLWGSEQVDTPHLLTALLEEIPPRLASVLERGPLDLDLGKMRQHLDQYLREVQTQIKQEVAFRLPPGLILSEDLTYRARTEDLSKAPHLDSYFDVLTRALYRRRNHHLLVTGLRGVGKTTLVWELARRAATGEIPFLKRKRFLWVDCWDIALHASKSTLEGVLAHVTGRTDLILCLDGMGPLLRAESGGNNKLILRAALKEHRVHLIGVMSNWDFEDLLSTDHELLEFFTRVNVEEPEEEATVDIVRHACAQLEQDYGVTFEERAIERSVILSADYILNERLPAKAIKILQRVCEDLDYERTQHGGKQDVVTVANVIKVVAEFSSLPEGTLEGVTEHADYEKDLAEAVVGQDEAVQAVASELRLIKAGMTEPGKPASVMFFAGLTGVGKTELAKTLAQFYSSSKRLQTYTMANFTEPHSISAIIGVPPGYVGHEQGGRLINDLNSDPYCVFLLDEADKAHPDVWKPFLNLFDEGWIVDQRGVKAFADRAIFILTSNAGHEIISSMSQAGNSMDEIIEAVKDALPKVKHERSSQPVFSPEFLARIKRIIIFNPLDKRAMKGICQKLVGQMKDTWEEKREKTIDIPPNLIKYIAEQSDTENTKSGGKEGGRIVRKLMSELIEVSIQKAAGQHIREYKDCNLIKLTFFPPESVFPSQPTVQPKVLVNFRTESPLSPAECIAQASTALKRELRFTQDATFTLHKVTSECLARLEVGLERWAREAEGQTTYHGLEDYLKRFRQACSDLERYGRHSEQEGRAVVEDLIRMLKVAAEGGFG